MSMLVFTGLSLTREVERGTMESLLVMPISPLEVMLGKILPYVLVGLLQGTLVLGAAVMLFGVPVAGSIAAAGGAHDPVHHDQPVDRLHLLDIREDPAAIGPDGDDVFPSEHPAVGLHVSVRRHADAGRSGSARACR